MVVTVDLGILKKICDPDNCGYCLCKVDIACPCEEVFNLKWKNKYLKNQKQKWNIVKEQPI